MKKLTLLLVAIFALNTINAQIKTTVKMSGEKTERIYVGTLSQGLSFHKVTKKSGESRMYMSLYTRSTFLTSTQPNVILYFEDGSTLKLKQQVNYDNGSGDYWDYSSWITLNSSLKVKLLKSKLIGFELYIFEQTIDGAKVINALNLINKVSVNRETSKSNSRKSRMKNVINFLKNPEKKQNTISLC